MRTRREVVRRRLIITGALLIVLVGIPAALWAVDTYYMPLDMLWAGIMRKLGMTAFLDQVRQGG